MNKIYKMRGGGGGSKNRSLGQTRILYQLKRGRGGGFNLPAPLHYTYTCG